MKKLLFVFLTLFSANKIFAATADILHEDPWRVLEYKFVTKPQKKANSWKNLGIKGATALGSGFTSYSLYALIHSYIFKHGFSLKYWPGSTATLYPATTSKLAKFSYYPIVPTSLSSTVLAYDIINQLLVAQYQKEELSDFLRHWDKYKKHIPDTLIKKLNEIHEDYLKNKDDVEKEAEEIIDVIVSGINLHFYGDPKARNFFDIRTLSANFNTHFVLDLAKIIDSIVKAFNAYNGNNNTTNGSNRR